jgi:hypothetical protein
MLRLTGVLAAITIVMVLESGISVAQTPPSVFSPSPFVDKGAEKSRIKQEEERKKWSVCKKQARAQKVKLRHWNKFMNDCMAK